MSVIIRLQNLPWSANALDIRQYFHGLSIPEGGVHIVGGELGDAFIAFSTDEDARQAFNRNNGKIKEIQINLMLSSRTEMQKVIEAARKQSLAAFMQAPPAVQAHLPTAVPQLIPSAIPELKKEEDKTEGRRDRRRSRSKSRERKDRSRERDRRDRHSRRGRSRSRSRERRERRRRERSRSRDRTRSKERDRRDRSRERKRSVERSSSKDSTKPVGVWESPNATLKNQPPTNLNNFVSNLPTLANVPLLNNGFQGNHRNNWQMNNSNGPNTQQNESLNKLSFQNQQTNNRFNQRPNFNQNNTLQFQDNSSNNRFNNRPSNNDNFNTQHEPQQIEFRNCCVRLRPYYGGYGEIRRFFQGLFIHNTGIKFVNDDNGKRTGIVYVRFAYPEGKEQALERNGKLLKNQVSEVIHLEDEDFENAIDRYQPDYQDQDSNEGNFRNKPNLKFNNKPEQRNNAPSNNFSCLIVEELPNFAKEQDILKMFNDYSLMSIFIVNRPRKSVVAYVKFANYDEAKKAYDDKLKHIIDTTPVLVKPCRDDLFEQISREQNELMDNCNDNLDKNNYIEADSNCVLLTGLPIKTNDRDVTDIFSDVGIMPDKIHLITSNIGFNGEAFCEFCSIQDAQIALEKDGMPLGSSIISVKCVPRSEMEAILGIRQPNTIQLKGVNHNQRPFFQPRNTFMVGPRGPPNFMGMRLPMRRFPPPPLQQNPCDMGPPGCTVLMDNVPYKAGLDEILEFFNDFDIIPDNILRKFNPNGKPSGETKVIFGNADEAYQAVEQKNRQKIRDRTIYLTLC